MHRSRRAVSAGLARARLPFRTANVVTGAAIGGFTFFVYAWSIRAVKQDDFSDVEMPSETVKAATVSIEEAEKERIRAKSEMMGTLVNAGGLEKGVIAEKTKEAFKGM